VTEAGEHLIDARPDDGERKQAVVLREVDPLVERSPGDGVHREERRPVGERAEVARTHDGRMREPREGARLLLEPPRILGPRRLAGPTEELHGDALVEDEIPAEVDDTHAAPTELTPHLIAAREDRSRLVCALVAHRQSA
jgi:hypothetical protein